MEGQTATRAPRLGGPEPLTAARPRAGALPAVPRSILLAIAACVVLAALSAAVLPTVPSYDPWSWIVWGREVSDPHLSFLISGGPSWKPLPFCFTTLYGLFGGAAPTLWVITARAGGLLGLVAAYRLAARLAASESSWTWAPVLAGLVAAAAIVLTHDAGGTEDWAYYMFRGTSEPMLIGAVLWAVDRHLDGRRGAAFVLLVAASLIRPETWPFVLADGVWLWVSWPLRRVRALVVAGWASIPFLWFVPPWVGSGNPFLAATHAKAYNGHLGADRLLSVLGRGVDVQLLPVLLLAVIAVALAWWRRRDRIVLGLGACAAIWWVVVVGMTLDGYPGLERFFLPAAAVICVLAGVGIVALGREAVALLPGARARPAAAAGLAATLALVAVCALAGSGRISTAWGQRAAAARAVSRLNGLSRAVAAVGGHAAVFPCPSSVAAVNHGVQTALAWKLHTTLERVGTSLDHSGVDFVGPHDSIDGGPAPLSRALRSRQLLASVDGWRVYRMLRPDANLACVGR